MVGVLRWLLFVGAPLIAAAWVAVRAVQADEADRLDAARVAGAQGCAGLLVLYGLAGAAWLGFVLLWTVVGRGGA